MVSNQFDNVVVFLADEKPEMRRLLLDAFRSNDLRGVREFSDSKALEIAASASVPPDLIVIDVALPGGDVFAMVKRIRAGDLGVNPFVPVILMTWNADGVAIKNAVDCGVDYILAAPFSPADVFKRIKILINERKPFVVTSEYIGPDRRRDPGRGDTEIPQIDVPNTLRAKARGEHVDLVDLGAAVSEARE
ncbi:MAG: response regulator [Rhodospirillaceae bacterium]|nr:response regulator [Rhodospirillaceae bacterium]